MCDMPWDRLRRLVRFNSGGAFEGSLWAPSNAGLLTPEPFPIKIKGELNFSPVGFKWDVSKAPEKMTWR